MEEHQLMTVEKFDAEVAKVSLSLKEGQQRVQDLGNESVIHAALNSDYTFFTKLYQAVIERPGMNANKLKAWIEFYGGCVWDKDASADGQFKKNHDSRPNPTEAVKATNAWFTFKSPASTKPFDPVQFFVRQTKTVGNKGKDDLFNPTEPVQQEAVNDLIRALKNEGFEIAEPKINPIEVPTMAIPDWKQEVEEQIAA